MRVYLSNLGCKLNQAETDHLTRSFRAAGYSIADSLDQADLHVVNSCTVTHLAARDSRKLARRGRKSNPEMRTVLTGCYVESDPREAADLAGVDLVIPNNQKDRLVERLHDRFPEIRPLAAGETAPCGPDHLGARRAPVKIEDGCNMRCSFCVIPMTRGPQQSRSPAVIRREVGMLVAQGYHEVVVTGVQISSYASAGYGLFELTENLLETTEVARLRLSSIAPWQFDRRLLDLMDSGRICDHFHLSIQSGSNRTLERMRRPYSSAQFADLVHEIRERVPDIAITTDLIVGFPGESDQDFRSSLDFVDRMDFARIHAFPFSAREGTLAAGMPHAIETDRKRDRMKLALELAEATQQRYYRTQQGATGQALWETSRDGFWSGTTANYIRVLLPADGPAANRLDTIELLEATESGMRCRLPEGPAWSRTLPSTSPLGLRAISQN